MPMSIALSGWASSPRSSESQKPSAPQESRAQKLGFVRFTGQRSIPPKALTTRWCCDCSRLASVDEGEERYSEMESFVWVAMAVLSCPMDCG